MLRDVLRDLIESGTPILADAGIETRIMFETDLELDPHIEVTALLDQRDGREVLRDVYATYVDVAWAHGLPAIIGTPTFRASLRYVEGAGRGGVEAVRRLNSEAVAFLHEIRSGGDHEPVFIAGVIGPYGDAYRPEDCLSHLDGADYHAAQAEALAEAGVDLLFAPTFPSVEEAHGAAVAMSQTSVPYAVSFVLNQRGRLLDGTYLHDAIERIDDAVVPAPTHYGISCVHPTVVRTALQDLHVASARGAARLREVKANGSSLAPGQLVALDHAESDPPEVFGESMHQLGIDFGVSILGGCCGTDAKHLAALARRLEAKAA
ncbi:homocysteine S-methyltransferase [Conexibacter woesei DSM 14684]|uniref:Homocysteine S-methyltransferase n=1 Tax=Conexibacter woesei (strain DSM 14684 / CCUG 47730 / CIP 108061 / JCM 11494 / NBRC 100937 / ID131577) TaxID=469383 RepID=D3FFF0_CONWI|nr:homocysteine S-methyltransferase [Conexibacter woesei DSM 14684]